MIRYIWGKKRTEIHLIKWACHKILLWKNEVTMYSTMISKYWNHSWKVDLSFLYNHEYSNVNWHYYWSLPKMYIMILCQICCQWQVIEDFLDGCLTEVKIALNTCEIKEIIGGCEQIVLDTHYNCFILSNWSQFNNSSLLSLSLHPSIHTCIHMYIRTSMHAYIHICI